MRRLPGAYLAVVVAVAIARAVSGHPSLSSLALTPDRLAQGRVWLMLTSAVIVNGPVVPQVAGLIAAIVVATRRLGARFTVFVMVVAHIAATLLTYAVLAVFTGDADGAHNHQLDYGISAVWLGALGALAVAALPAARRGSRRAVLVVGIGAAAFVAGVAFFPLLASVEHGLAFALGAGLAALRAQRSAAYRSVPRAASTASVPAESA